MGYRSALGLSVMATLCLVGRPAHADEIDDLEPGNWYEIPNTPMRDVCPPNTDDYDWSFHCAGAIAAWSGGVIDTSRGRLVVWGGGHADYRGNEVYTFDLATLEWSRIWGPTDDAQIPSGGTHEEYDDGNPGSRHTYSGLVYLPPPHDTMVTSGGSLWQSGFYGSGVWRYAFGDDAWTRLADGPGEMGYGDPMVYDPESGHAFRRANSRMFEYDPDADMFIPRADSDGGFWASNVSAALDLSTRTMVIMGDDRVDLYHLDSDTYEQDVAIEGPNVVGGGSPGIAYDPEQERIVVWTGGLDVYTFDVDARSFSQHEIGGDDPGPITPSGGAFGRFRYAPSRNVFVYVDHVDSNVFVLRMSEGQGVPPDPPDDDGGSESDDGGDTTGDDSGVADSTGGGSPGTDDGAPPPTTGPVGTDGGETPTSSGGEDGSQDEDASGCSCRAAGSPGWALLAPFALLALARRRY